MSAVKSFGCLQKWLHILNLFLYSVNISVGISEVLYVSLKSPTYAGWPVNQPEFHVSCHFFRLRGWENHP